MQNSSDNDIIEAGIDEAGRGCMSGRVYTACVILPNTYPDDTYLQIIDSKKISAKKRTILKKYIEDVALAYSVEYADIEEIESKNILHATIAAMHRAIDKIEIKPENILVDGNYFRIYKSNKLMTLEI